jgi:rod shape-determining protein MreD
MMVKKQGWGVIIITLFLGLMFLATPLPNIVSVARPLLILLVILYWALYCPDHVGVGIAWFMGLITDFMYGIMLGPYAMGFAACAYLMVRLNARLRMFPLFQQTLFMGMLVAGVQCFVMTLSVLLGHENMAWPVLWSVPTSMLCWPVVILLLDCYGPQKNA